MLAKVPAEAQTELKTAYWKLFDVDDVLARHPVGPELVAFVQARIDAFADTYGGRYPAAVKCLLADREQLTSYLRFPAEHHRRIRHSNFIERTFGETRRRVKVIGRLPGEASCLQPGLGRPGPSQPRLARLHHDQRWHPPAAGPAPRTARTTGATPTRQANHRATTDLVDTVGAVA